MPSSSYPDELANFLIAHAPDKKLLGRVWQKLLPMIKNAYSNEYPLVDARLLDEQTAIKAISVGLCTKVDRVRFVSMGDDFLKGLEEEHLATHAVMSFSLNRRPIFEANLGEDTFADFVMQYYAELGRPLVESFIDEHIGDLIEMKSDLTVIIPHIPTLTLFYILVSLLAGEEEQVEEMLPLYELVQGAIPLGEPWDDLGTWIVLVK